MKKMIVPVFIIASAIFFAGCGGSAGDPKATLVSFFDALGKKDIEGAKKLATAESQSMLGMMEMAMKMDKGENKDMDKFDKSKMEIGDVKIDGDKATVPVKEKESGELTNFTLKKEEGKWKVAFDKSTIMEMATSKMKEHGVDTDSLKNAAEELKKMNIDSLKDNINKGIGALDSAKKELEKLKSE